MSFTILLLPLLFAGGCFLEPPALVGRADLAESYLQFERAFADSPPSGSALASANRAFDGATFAFFGGQYSLAVSQIDALTDRLTSADESLAQRVATSLKVVLDPPVYVIGSGAPLRVRVQSMYAVLESIGIKDPVAIEIRRSDGTTVLSRSFPALTGLAFFVDQSVEIPATELTFDTGAYSVFASFGDASGRSPRRWFVVPRSLDSVRAENSAKLDALVAAGGALAPAVAACRSRNSLLTNDPLEDNSAQFLADLSTLPAQVASELETIAQGGDPYRRRTGDYWRTVGEGNAALPLRVFAPAAAGGEDAVPLPLLIALHGAGGDENMFFEGYGAGRIRPLADERGIIVAAPQTTALLADPGRFDTLLAELGASYNIDPDRVYVLGHSLGAVTAAELGSKRPAVIAAIVCLGGYSDRSGDGTVPPTWAICGALDLISQPGRIRTRAEAARAAGKPVEVQIVDDYGHTLIVGAKLTEALDWLLEKKRGTAKPSASNPATTAPSR